MKFLPLALSLVFLFTGPFISVARAADAPKKILVVSTTCGYRHGSIPTLKKMLEKLAAQTGEFTLDFVDQPDGKPVDLKKDATPEEHVAYKAAEADWEEIKLKVALEKLSPDSLKNYDAVIFASTTGDLPIPDKPGFLDWIKAGHAFIGLHSASDTFHKWPGYIDMLGGEFKQHGAQVSVDCLNQDPQNAATASLPKVWTLSQEEIYQFKNYDPAKVHELLIMDKHPNDKTPGHYPVSWCKNYGAGRVFYTSLGHRDDIIDADPNLKDRKNSLEISQAYDAHVLGGIEWALGLKPEAISGAERPLLNEKLTAWEIWMGVPHQTVTGLPPGTPTSPDGHAGTPLGLNNDPLHVYSVDMTSGEPVLHITGQIFGGLTTLESFSNYHFRTEFKWGERKWEPKLKVVRDNGILFDCTGPHGAMWNVWKSSFEFQVEEKNMGDLYIISGTSATVPVIDGPKNWHYDPAGPMMQIGGPGSVTGKVAHLAGDFEKPNGEWNVLELYTLGQSAVYVVNGHVVQVLRQTQSSTPEHKLAPVKAGQIQIQSEGAECYYRRMEIEPITELPAEIKQTAGL
jgi:type 1 glutamine amidotransferase